MARSVPRRGNRTNAASGGPMAAPIVFASVTVPAARVSSAIDRDSPSPIDVNRTPERKDVGSVRIVANQTTRGHSPTCVPLVNVWNDRYESATAHPLAKATTGTNEIAVSLRLD